MYSTIGDAWKSMQTEMADMRKKMMEARAGDAGMLESEAKGRGRMAGSFLRHNALLLAVGAVVAALAAGMFNPRARKAIEKSRQMAHEAMQGMGHEHTGKGEPADQA